MNANEVYIATAIQNIRTPAVNTLNLPLFQAIEKFLHYSHTQVATGNDLTLSSLPGL